MEKLLMDNLGILYGNRRLEYAINNNKKKSRFFE